MSERLKLAEYFVGHHSDAAIGAIQQMPADTATEIIEAIDDSLSIRTLKTLLPAKAAQCLETMSGTSASKYLNRLNAKDAAAILRYMGEEPRKTLLGKLTRRHALRVSILLRYPQSLVGGWMDTVKVCLQPDTLVSDARAQVAQSNYNYSEVYIASSQNQVMGSVSLVDLLHANHDLTVNEIMKPVGKPINASLTLDEGIEWESWAQTDILPVIDSESNLVGIVRFVDLWGALVDVSPPEKIDDANTNIFGILEVYCLRLADLATAMLSAKHPTS